MEPNLIHWQLVYINSKQYGFINILKYNKKVIMNMTPELYYASLSCGMTLLIWVPNLVERIRILGLKVILHSYINSSLIIHRRS